jgi:hypothetical protein
LSGDDAILAGEALQRPSDDDEDEDVGWTTCLQHILKHEATIHSTMCVRLLCFGNGYNMFCMAYWAILIPLTWPQAPTQSLTQLAKYCLFPSFRKVLKIIVWIVWTYYTKCNYALVTIDHYYEWTQHMVIHRYSNKVINTYCPWLG